MIIDLWSLEGVVVLVARRGVKLWVAAGVAGLAVVSGLVAPPAHADGLGGITGFEPAPETCGTANLMPVVATNATNVAQTLTLQVPEGGMAEQVRYLTSTSQFIALCPQRDGSGIASTNSAAWTQSITVQPGTSATFYLSLGGVDYNLIGGSSFSIQGGGNSWAGPAWISAKLNLGADEQFQSLETMYEFLGSTSSPGFNIFACNTSQPVAGGEIFATSKVLTPYASVTTSGPTYGSGEPMCLGWIPQGTYVDTSLSSFQNGQVLAVVTNSNGLPPGGGTSVAGPLAGQVVNTSAAIQLPGNFGTATKVYAASVGSSSATPPPTILASPETMAEWVSYSFPFTQIDNVLIIESFPVLCGGYISVVAYNTTGGWATGNIGIGSGLVPSCDY